jgi:tetratricopeptide (TPR) repeat protein
MDRPIKIAVIGNSNSIGRNSYTQFLAGMPGLQVVNRSIGATPNVVLLDFLAGEENFDYDYVIVETAVVDFLQAGTMYTRDRSKETLELFVRCMRSVSKARLLFLLIPTQTALLHPGRHWQEDLYLEIAGRFSIPVIDGFALIRSLIGPARMRAASLLMGRSQLLVSAFRLPSRLAEPIAWRSLRDNSRAGNAMGIYGFTDGAHLSPAVFMMIARILAQYVILDSNRVRAVSADPQPAELPVRRLLPSGCELITRTSRLMSRIVVRFSAGDHIIYRCPQGYRVLGILINQAATSCVLHMSSPAGNTVFDMRMPQRVKAWEGIIVPVLDAIGDGDVRVWISETPEDVSAAHRLAGVDSRPAQNVAEIGELILVQVDADHAADQPDYEIAGPQRIEQETWAERIIEEATGPIATFVRGMEGNHYTIDLSSLNAVVSLMLSETFDSSPTEKARILLAIGLMDRLKSFLDSMPISESKIGEIDHLRQTLLSMRPTNAGELFDKAVACARSGNDAEAEILVEQGMTLYPDELRFFVQWAWLPFHRKDWSSAADRWSFVRDAFPTQAHGHIGLAHTLRMSGDLAKTEAFLQSAIKRFPDHGDLHFLHADIAINRGQLSEALARLKGMRMKFPAHRRARLLLISTEIKMENHTAARSEIVELLDHDPVTPTDDLLPLSLETTLKGLDPGWLQNNWEALTTRISKPEDAFRRATSLLSATTAASCPEFVRSWLARQKG